MDKPTSNFMADLVTKIDISDTLTLPTLDEFDQQVNDLIMAIAQRSTADKTNWGDK